MHLQRTHTCLAFLCCCVLQVIDRVSAEAVEKYSAAAEPDEPEPALEMVPMDLSHLSPAERVQREIENFDSLQRALGAEGLAPPDTAEPDPAAAAAGIRAAAPVFAAAKQYRSSPPTVSLAERESSRTAAAAAEAAAARARAVQESEAQAADLAAKADRAAALKEERSRRAAEKKERKKKEKEAERERARADAEVAARAAAAAEEAAALAAAAQEQRRAAAAVAAAAAEQERAAAAARRVAEERERAAAAAAAAEQRARERAEQEAQQKELQLEKAVEFVGDALTGARQITAGQVQAVFGPELVDANYVRAGLNSQPSLLLAVAALATKAGINVQAAMDAQAIKRNVRPPFPFPPGQQSGNSDTAAAGGGLEDDSAQEWTDTAEEKARISACNDEGELNAMLDAARQRPGLLPLRKTIKKQLKVRCTTTIPLYCSSLYWRCRGACVQLQCS
jgi:hypothetical protein